MPCSNMYLRGNIKHHLTRYETVITIKNMYTKIYLVIVIFDIKLTNHMYILSLLSLIV